MTGLQKRKLAEKEKRKHMQGVSWHKKHGDAVGAAVKGKAMQWVQPQGGRQCSGCSCKGHSDIAHAVTRGHVSIVAVSGGAWWALKGKGGCVHR